MVGHGLFACAFPMNFIDPSYRVDCGDSILNLVVKTMSIQCFIIISTATLNTTIRYLALGYLKHLQQTSQLMAHDTPTCTSPK